MKKWLFLITLIFLSAGITFWQVKLIEGGNITEANEEIQKTDTVLADGRAMCSLKISPENALSFNIEIGETLNAYSIDKDKQVDFLGEILVHKISRNDVRGFGILVIEGDEHTIMSIISGKNNGLIELARVR